MFETIPVPIVVKTSRLLLSPLSSLPRPSRLTRWDGSTEKSGFQKHKQAQKLGLQQGGKCIWMWTWLEFELDLNLNFSFPFSTSCSIAFRVQRGDPSCCTSVNQTWVHRRSEENWMPQKNFYFNLNMDHRVPAALTAQTRLQGPIDTPKRTDWR